MSTNRRHYVSAESEEITSQEIASRRLAMMYGYFRIKINATFGGSAAPKDAAEGSGYSAAIRKGLEQGFWQFVIRPSQPHVVVNSALEIPDALACPFITSSIVHSKPHAALMRSTCMCSSTFAEMNELIMEG